MSYNEQIESDEISLKDLILLVQKYFNILLKSWLVIGIVAIIFAGLFFYRAHKKEVTYTAELSYTASESSGLSGIAGGLVGRFLGGGGKSNPIIKAQAMANTRRIAQMTLFKKALIDGEHDYLINHHARVYELEDKLEETEDFKGFKPFKDDKLSTEDERFIFNAITKTINKRLISQSYDEDNGMAALSITSPSEAYSIALSTEYFLSLVEFYTDTEVGEQQRTLEALEDRADSIYNAIQTNVYRVAKIQDSDRGIFLAVDKVPEVKATTELSFLRAAYEEIVKNLETIKFTVASNSPSISAIDYPVTPIKANSRGRLKAIIIGGFLGGFLTSLFILGRAIFREIMTDEDELETSIT